MLALDGATVVGRLGGYVAPIGALRLWSIAYGDKVPEARRDDVAHALVAHAVEIARDRPDVRFVESRPGYDSPDLHRLLVALESAGLRRASEAHVYSAPASTCARDRAGSPGLDVERVEPLDDENQPSIALHERAGLTRSEGPLWTYRLVL